MAEGDTIHRNARRLEAALGGEPLTDAAAPNARSPLRGQAALLSALRGRRLARAGAHGKHLFLRFEGDLTLHCHQGMTGSWQLTRDGEGWARPRSAAWVVLSTPGVEAAEFGGPHLALRTDAQLRRDPRLRALGPDILAGGFTAEAGVRALRERTHGSTELGDALLDQSVIAGIGNIFKSEGCWQAELDPWRAVGSLDDDKLAQVVGATRELMRAALAGGGPPQRVYKRARRPCPRCGAPLRSRGQGDANRTTYWCARCQT